MQKKTSNKQLLQFNLAILIQERRATGPAFLGYKKIAAAIKAKKDDFLFHILRHQNEGSIYLKKELDIRAQTDALINFYSLLQIAHMAGYIPPKLPEDLQQEIITILDHPAVKKYYEKNYPLLLPQIILRVVQKKKVQKITGTPALFREMLLIDYKEDDDVVAFLSLLDGFYFGDKDIDALNKLLSSKKQITDLLNSPRKYETNFEKAFWGFIKYNDYMKLYENLLLKCDNELFRSAVWHYKGYWFSNVKALMKDKYATGINNINELAGKTSVTEYKRNFSAGISKKKLSAEKFDYQQSYAAWKKDYKEQVKKVTKSMAYNLNGKHSKALKEYFKTL